MSTAPGKSTTRNRKGSKDSKDLILALQHAEVALADIGDAERDPGDDIKWCEGRAAEVLPLIRKTLDKFGANHSGLDSFPFPGSVDPQN